MMHRYPFALVALVACTIPQLTHAQADECSGATPINIVAYGACGGVQGNNGSATDSGTSPSCDATNVGFKDVWYGFNTGNSTTISITLTPGTATDWNFMIYDACGGTELDCQIIPSGAITYNVTPNTAFKLQVESNLQYGNGGTFTLCIEGNGGGGGGITNDDCADAVPVEVLPMNGCGALSGTTEGATWSGIVPSCDAFGSSYADVWYSFNTGNNTTLDITLTPIGAGSWGHAIFDVCGGTELVCAPGTFNTDSYSVPPNTDFLLLVWSNLDQGQAGSFELCLEAPNGSGTPPVNDVCSGAITLPVGSTCVNTTGDVDNAFSHGTSSCDGDVMYDLWYRFIAPGPSVVVRVDGSTLFDPVLEVLQGGCGSTDLYACENATQEGGVEQAELNGLTAGTTYTVHVYQPYMIAPSSTTFTICAYAPAAINECDGAQELTMQPTCVPVNGDAQGATDSGTFADCGQQGSADDDVWYSFVATSGDVRITVDGNGAGANGYDPVVHLRYGCPGNSLACVNATGGGGTEVLEFLGITAGNTYYVQVYDAGTGQPGNTTYTICVQDISIGAGTEERDLSEGWSITCAEGFATLFDHGLITGPATFTLADPQGRTVLRSAWASSLGPMTQVPLPELSTGIYLAELRVNNRRSIKRVLVP